MPTSLQPVNRIRTSARHLVIAACVLAFVGIAAAPAFATIATSPKAGMWGVDGRVWAMTRIGNILYVGGIFQNAVSPDGSASVPRQNLAAIDASTGQPTSWNPGANAVVYALANDGSDVFVGGDFTTIGGVDRARMAELDASGNVTSFVADATRKVRALAISGSTLYMGGQFDRVTDSTAKSQRRIRIAGIDLTSDTLTALKATPNKSVLSIAVVPSGAQAGNLVVGGIFTSMNGDANQQRITELAPDGQLAGWQSHPIDLIWSVEIVNDTVYAGRGGSQGGSISAYDLNGNLSWNHHADGDVQAVSFANGEVIAGGHFGNIDSQHIPRLAAFTPNGAPDTSWVPKPNSVKGVWALVATSSALDVGGDFTTINGQGAPHVAELAVT